MSPNGQKAPPALAAITKFTKPILMNFSLSEPTANTTAPTNKAAVRLSATADRKKVMIPVIKNNLR